MALDCQAHWVDEGILGNDTCEVDRKVIQAQGIEVECKIATSNQDTLKVTALKLDSLQSVEIVIQTPYKPIWLDLVISELDAFDG